MIRRLTLAIAASNLIAGLPSAQSPHTAFVQKWCGSCHAGDDAEADLDLIATFGRGLGTQHVATAIAVRDALVSGTMPPDDEPQPPARDVARVIASLKRFLARAARESDPSRVTMRRLSRSEYRYTIRDLFGVTEDVTVGFPADDLAYGFDNIGDATNTSVLHVEKYAEAAKRVSEWALASEDAVRAPQRRIEAENHTATGRRVHNRSGYAVFITNSRIRLPVQLPRPGRYRVRIRACADQAGDEPARMALFVDGEERRRFDVACSRRKPEFFTRELLLPSRRPRLEIAFVNDYFNKKAKPSDRNLWVDWVEIVGPLDANPRARWILANAPRVGAARERAAPIVREVLRRVWRRPPTRHECDRFEALVAGAVADGDSFLEAIQLALQAALVSPHFLYRAEPGGVDDETRVESLGAHALATRLSYFLWSSSPDSELSRLADRGGLVRAETLAAQTRRMLEDPRADALAENFAAQWLELRTLETVEPDPKRFPGFSPALRRAMRRETELLFRHVLRERRDIRELIDADYTFLNETLAMHYGLASVRGNEFRRVLLGDDRRGGLLGHASILTVTSNPTRTSPVKRGKWLLENLLDDPVPPPEPGFDSLPADVDATVASTLRAQLARHRRDAKCAVCHDRMDPLGLALENYDAIGRWRSSDNGVPIDVTATLPSGGSIDGVRDLRRALRSHGGLVRSLAKKLFTYAIGREPRGRDELAVERLVASLRPPVTVAQIVSAIVQLDAFRRRRTTK